MPGRRARSANLLTNSESDMMRQTLVGNNSASRNSTFAFRPRSGRVDWAALSSVDVERIVQLGDLDTLQSVLDNISFADLASEGVRTAADTQLVKFGRVAQLGLEYLLHVQDVLAAALQDAQHGTSSEAYTSLNRRHRRLEARHASVQEQLRAAESELINSRRDRSRLLWICAQKSGGQAKAHWCRMCTKVFDTKASLQSHAARRHFEQQALACGECDEQIGPADSIAADAAANASSYAIMDAKVLEAISQLRKEFESDLSVHRQELEESKLRERALRAQIIELGKAAEDARVQQRRQQQVVEMPNVEHIQQLATATASAVAVREVMKIDPRQLVQELKDELVCSFSQKMAQLESQSGCSDATIAAMRSSMQRERESTVSEVKQMMHQLQLELQRHYEDNVAQLTAAAAVREAELVAEANAAKQVAAEAAAAAAAAERIASAAAAALERNLAAPPVAAPPVAAPPVAAPPVAAPPVAAPPITLLIQEQPHRVISAQSLQDVSSSSAPSSPESTSSVGGAVTVGSVAPLSQFQQHNECLPILRAPSPSPEKSVVPVLVSVESTAAAAAAAAAIHLSSASEVEDGSDSEPVDSASHHSEQMTGQVANSEAPSAVAATAASAGAAASHAPDSPSSSSSAHTSLTASPDEVKPARVDALQSTPPPAGRMVQAKLTIDDVLPLQALQMPPDYTGSPIMSRVLLTVDEIQQQLQHVETFLSRRRSAASASASASAAASTSALQAAPSLSRNTSSFSTLVQSHGSAARDAARVSDVVSSATLAHHAVSELQRRQEQQQVLRSSGQAAAAKLDEDAQQAAHLRSLLLHGSGGDSDSDDSALRLSASSLIHQQQHREAEPAILAPVTRSQLLVGRNGSKTGSGALISDTDSDSSSDEAAGVSRAPQLRSGVPASSVLSANALRSAVASTVSPARASGALPAASSSSDEDSDYEEDFDAESGSSSNRRQPVKVQVVQQKPAAALPPAFGSTSAKPHQKVAGLVVDSEDFVGSEDSSSDNEVMAFGGRDLGQLLQQSQVNVNSRQQQPSTPPAASQTRSPQPPVVWATDDISDVEELI